MSKKRKLFGFVNKIEILVNLWKSLATMTAKQVVSEWGAFKAFPGKAVICECPSPRSSKWNCHARSIELYWCWKTHSTEAWQEAPGTILRQLLWEQGEKAEAEAWVGSDWQEYCQLIREMNRAKRLEFCLKCVEDNKQFDVVIFTDECSVHMEKHAKFCFHRKLEQLKLKGQAKHPFKVHISERVSREEDRLTF